MKVINEEISTQIPMISIAMLTYNHESFIEQAIKSVILQDTLFSYQLIIGEDCSNDNTREIVLKYANLYPDKIIAILQDCNVGIKTNALSVRKYLRGKYIATLEGDDYWTDNHKLQKQVEFLEKNTDYIAVCHNHMDVDSSGTPISGVKAIELKSGYSRSKIYDIVELGKYYLSGHTSTLLYRNFFYIINAEQFALYCDSDVIGDRKLNLVLACLGKTYKLDDVMSVYRHHESAWTAVRSSLDLSYHGFYSIEKLQKLAYDMFGIWIDFEYGKMKSWYGVFYGLCKEFNKDNLDKMLRVFNEGNRFKKLVFIISHTISFPYRKYFKERC